MKFKWESLPEMPLFKAAANSLNVKYQTILIPDDIQILTAEHITMSVCFFSHSKRLISACSESYPYALGVAMEPEKTVFGLRFTAWNIMKHSKMWSLVRRCI